MYKKPNRQTVYLWVMKGLLGYFFLFISAFSFANIPSNGQSILQRKVSLVVENMKVKDILNRIEKSDSVLFAYLDNPLKINRQVSLSIEDSPLEKVLDMLFDNKISLEARGNLVIIKSAIADAGAAHVTGTVRDADGEPLPGVNVVVKGTLNGTSTDVDGKYAISVEDAANAILVFSFVGYISQEVRIGSKSVIDIQLASDQKHLDEVVVIGYGTSKVKDLTGSVGEVSIADMAKAPVISMDQALAGRVAGVQVNSSDGQPGAPVDILIRGANSITQANSPLYVVDGFPIEGFNLNTFNPRDIKSIDVLKDASATAIYGARGANGVVIITTKGGEAGKPVISFDASQCYSHNIRTMELMNSYEFVKYQIEQRPGLGSASDPTPTYSYLTLPNKTLEDYKNVRATDWQAPFFKTGSLGNYSLAVRGGTDQTAYSLSGSFDNLAGTIIATGYSRYQGRITLDQAINSKVKAGVNANYAYLSQAGSLMSGSNYSATKNILYSVWGYNPLSLLTLTEPLDPTTASANDYKFNPVLNQSNRIRNVKTNNLNVNAYLTYKITPRLTLKVTGVLNSNIINTEVFNNSKTSDGSPLTNDGQLNGVNGTISTPKVNNWVNENTLTYNRVFNKAHSLNILGGFTEQGNTSSTYGFGANFIPNESLGIRGLDEGTLNPLVTKATSSLWNGASVLSRVAYNYNSTYYVTVSYRADGSSKFSEKNHWSYFPSGALSWRFTENSALKNNKWISDGKLRVSYGKTGNNRVSDFPYLSSSAILPRSSYAFNNAYVPSIIPLTVANPDLKWETTDQFDGGLDISFFNNRLNLIADVYRKITKDLLLNATLPTSTGYRSAYDNIGSVQNQGLELTLNTVNMNANQFKWTSSFNISFNQNKVLALANNQESLTSPVSWDGSWSSIPAYIAKIGQPLGLMYGYLSDGVYQYHDFNKTSAGTHVLKDNVHTNGNVRSAIQPGDIKYKDLNGDGVVNAYDYTVIGRSLPVHFGGFNNNFTYKNMELSIFFQWSYGNNIQNVNQMIFNGNAQFRANLEQYASYADRWSPENQGSSNHRAGGYFGGGYSSKTVEDGTYLRLKTASIGYNIPENLLKRAKITSLKIYASGQNLWTWTKYSGLDPEVSTYGSVLTGGFDYSAYPRARTIAFGINLTF